MPDFGDEAQRVADLHLHDTLAAHHRRIDEIRALHGRTECVGCGDEIPEARRKAVPNCQRCIECQRKLERSGS